MCVCVCVVCVVAPVLIYVHMYTFLFCCTHTGNNPEGFVLVGGVDPSTHRWEPVHRKAGSHASAIAAAVRSCP